MIGNANFKIFIIWT